MKLTRNIRFFTSAFVASLVLISCSESFFDAEMAGRIDTSQHFKNLEDVEASYTGCYSFLQDIAEKQVIADGLRSDQMLTTSNADLDMLEILRHEVSAGNKYLDPSDYYKLIINVNEVLPNLDSILGKDRDFDELKYTEYKGSLVTLRSWAYFMLSKINGEVGLVPEDQSTLDISHATEYLDKAMLVDKLIMELLEFDDPKDIQRFDMDHYVLLGELYLQKEDYVNAAKYLKFAIDGPYMELNTFMLGSVFDKDAWEDIFKNSELKTTTVFSAVSYSYVNAQKNMLEEWMSPEFLYMVKPSGVLLDSFSIQIQQNNKLGDLYRGEGVSYGLQSAEMPYINKYLIDEGELHSADVILYRAADVHLLLAEALNRAEEYDNAMQLLNRGFGSLITDERPLEYYSWATNKGVRGRSYLKEKLIPPSDTANPMLYIEDLIIQERALELAFEGKRWFDLIRIAERRDDPAFLADKVAAKFEDAATADAIRSKLMDPTSWYIPLPKVVE